MRNCSLERKEDHREELEKLILMTEHQISEVVKHMENYIKLMVEKFTDGIANRYLFRLANRS
jgi:ABC-type Mn2+/Zn2+ transport system ATPase subunit